MVFLKAHTDPSRPLVAVGVSNGAVCATALADVVRADVVHGNFNSVPVATNKAPGVAGRQNGKDDGWT